MADEATKEKEVIEVAFTQEAQKNLENIAKLGETMNATFDDLKKRWEVKPEDKKEVAPLNESITGSVKKATSQIVPVAIGGFAAIVVSEVIDGVLIKQKPMVRGLTKFAGAAAVYAWGKKIPFMGETGKNIFAGLLLFDALRDVTPISSWASQVANKVSGAIPVGGLGDQPGRDTRKDVLSQANTVVTNYPGVNRRLG